jgi:hypothetical protein
MNTALLALPAPRLPAPGGRRQIAMLAVAGMIHLLVASIVVLGFRAGSIDSTTVARSSTAPAIALHAPERLIFRADHLVEAVEAAATANLDRSAAPKALGMTR